MPFTGPAEDRTAIRELYESYADGANRCDRDVWLGCYAEDARWKTHYFDLIGRDAIGAKFDEIMQSVTDTTFYLQIGSIEVDRDTARCRMYQWESLLQRDGETYDLVGGYEDELERRDGRWLFKNRNYLVKREKLPLSSSSRT